MFAGWPLLLIQWVYALIYLSTALSKLGKSGLDWMNGYTLQYYLLADGLRDQNSFGIWLGQQHTIAWLMSWLTILFEGTFCLVLIFPRLVWIYVPFGIAFHLGIYMTMRAPFFVFIFLYTVFIPWVSLYTTLSHFLGWRQPVRNPSTLALSTCALILLNCCLI